MLRPSGASSASREDEASLPGWLLWLLVVGAVSLLAYAVTALVAAMLGLFRPTVVLPLSLAAATPSAIVALRELGPRRPAAPRIHVIAAVVLVAALVWTAWNGKHHGEPLIAERDPGVYAATALWLSDHGTLSVDGLEGPFRSVDSLRNGGMGFQPQPDGSLQPQFVHLTAIFMATAGWVDDTWIFFVNPVLAGAGLVVLYALGARLGPPLGAAAGVALFALSYPLLHVTRLTYSEPLALLLFFTGLLVLSLALEHRGVALGLLGGGLLGAVCMARVDAYVPLIPIVAWLAASTRLSLRADDLRWRVTAAAAGAMVITASLGAVEVWRFSRGYFSSDLAPRLPSMLTAAAVVATVMWTAAPRLWSRGERGRGDHLTPALLGLAGAVAGLLVAFVLWARFVRPDFDALRAAMATDLPTYRLGPKAWTTSYLWLEWYLGPVLPAVGLVGLLWLAWRGLREPQRDVALAFSGAAIALTVLYLTQPSITPDQPWAMRRFLTVSIPALCVAAGLGLASLARLRPRLVVAGAVGCTFLFSGAYVVHATWPLRSETVGRPLAARFNQICAIADEEPSAILIAPDRLLYATIPQTLQAWCDVPVAGATDQITAAEVIELDEAWAEEGRRLLVVATSPLGIDGVTGPGVMLPETHFLAAQRRLDGRPTEVVSDSRQSQSRDGRLPLFVLDVEPGWRPPPAPEEP